MHEHQCPSMTTDHAYSGVQLGFKPRGVVVALALLGLLLLVPSGVRLCPRLKAEEGGRVSGVHESNEVYFFVFTFWIAEKCRSFERIVTREGELG